MDEVVASLIARIATAPLEAEAWPGILADTASLTGGWGGELSATDRKRFIMYVTGDVPLELALEYDALGGGDPRRNPRAAALFSSTDARVMRDSEFVSAEVRARNPIYNEFLHPVGAHYTSIGILDASPERRMLVAITRTERQGPAEGRDHAIFEQLLPHFQTAARLQLRIESEAGRIAIGSLEAVGAAVVLCDWRGGIVDASRSAEAMLGREDLLRRRSGRLAAAHDASDQQLDLAIARAASWRPDKATGALAVLLRDSSGQPVGACDIAPLPRGAAVFGLGARVAVMMRAPREGRDDTLLRMAGLSQAEAEVARALAEGASPSEIAEQRRTSLQTVRTQIKLLYAKLGVSRQVELAAKVFLLG